MLLGWGNIWGLVAFDGYCIFIVYSLRTLFWKASMLYPFIGWLLLVSILIDLYLIKFHLFTYQESINQYTL